MIRKFSFFLALLVMGGLTSSISRAADVTVWVINGNTGQPFIRYPIKLYAADRVLYPHENTHLLAKADPGPDGSATFHLDPPLPEVLFIYVGDLSRTVGCNTNLNFLTNEVLRSGIVSRNICDRKNKLKLKFSAKPGEVVVFLRKKTFFDDL